MARGGRGGRRKATSERIPVQTDNLEASFDGEECHGDDERSVDDNIAEKEPLEEEVPQTPVAQSQPVQKTSYAAMVDPSEGIPLRFNPLTEIEGVKYAKIEQKDIEPEVQFWASAILCCVVGANPPLAVFEDYARRIWGKYEIDRIFAVKKGLYLVRFCNESDKWEVIQKGLYFFGNKPLLVREWNEEWDVNVEEAQTLPIWVQFPNLDLRYWGGDSLGKIGSLIGIPIKTDKITMEKRMIRYARVLIEVPLKGPFPDSVDFINEHGVIVRQDVKYEWKPVRCRGCLMYGHEEDVCRKKNGARWEWRPKPIQPTQPNHSGHPQAATGPVVSNAISHRTNTNAEEEEDQGFRQVPKRLQARRLGEATASVISADNSRFQSLMTESELVIQAEQVRDPQGGLPPDA